MAVVILVLPISLQPHIILKALAANKHVLSEKPIAPSVSEGRCLVAVYDAQYTIAITVESKRSLESTKGDRVRMRNLVGPKMYD